MNEINRSMKSSSIRECSVKGKCNISKDNTRCGDSGGEAEAVVALLLSAGGNKKDESSMGKGFKLRQQNEGSKSDVNNHFPSQLHDLLSSSELAGVAVEWLPHGRSWRVLRWEALTTRVMQKYFPQCVSDSDGLTLQLNAWGFHEIRTGSDRGSFQNDLFLRDNPQICKHMRLNKEYQSSHGKSGISEKLQQLEDNSTHDMGNQIAPLFHLENPSSVKSVIDVPENSNCFSTHMLNNSFPITSQSSPLQINAINAISQCDSNKVVTPSKNSISSVNPDSCKRRGNDDSPLFHRTKSISSSTTPISHQSQVCASFQSETPKDMHIMQRTLDIQPIMSKNEKDDEHVSRHRIQVSPLDTDMYHKKCESLAPPVINLANNQLEGMTFSLPLPHSVSNSSAAKGLRSARGRSSRILRSQLPSSQLKTETAVQTNSKSKTFAVSTRGGRTKTKINLTHTTRRGTKHVYTSSLNVAHPTRIDDMQNKKTAPPKQTHETAFLNSLHQQIDKTNHKIYHKDGAKETNTADSNSTSLFRLNSSSFPVAIAVSRKTKRLRQ